MTPLSQRFDVPLFAYGSSLSVAQMTERKVRWDEGRVEKAALLNYAIIFRGVSTRAEYLRGGLADVESDPGAKVHGVVFWTDGDLRNLDVAEGVFKPHPIGCRRIQVAVCSGTGVVAAQTYVRKDKGSPNPPHEAYLQKIVEGARSFRLSEEWIMEIQKVAERAAAEPQ